MNLEKRIRMELKEIFDRIMAGGTATVEEALALNERYSTDELCDAADEVRKARCGGRLDTCSIINARSGHCPEDCKFCAQSRFYATGIKEYEIVDTQEAVDAAMECECRGVRHFSLVTSGRRVSPQQIGKFCDIFHRMREACPQIGFCASMGLLSKEELQTLKDAGVRRYHCNLEASSDYFPTLCSTHSHEDKIRTITAAKEVGLEVCSGGIIGMGENLAQRLRLVKECYEAGAISIPVNILNPIPGTPLGDTAPLSDDDIVRSVALMRFVAPAAVMRFAGGRARLPEKVTERILRGGMNGVMVGDLLTTIGNSVDDDYRMFERTGYEL